MYSRVPSDTLGLLWNVTFLKISASNDRSREEVLTEDGSLERVEK